MKIPKQAAGVGHAYSASLSLNISPLKHFRRLFCFIFGWRSLGNIGTGFIYGSLGLALFGAMTFAANTLPAQLSQLSLPKYKPTSPKRLQEAEGDDSKTDAAGKNLFLIMLISAACLVVTGFFLSLF